MSGRKVGTFMRSHKLNGVLLPAGTNQMMTTKLFEELKNKNIVKEYTGTWPPKQKTKFNLKDLR